MNWTRNALSDACLTHDVTIVILCTVLIYLLETADHNNLNHHGNNLLENTYIINVLIIIANVIKLNLVIIPGTKGVCLVDFGYKRADTTGRS